jgi:hypothetical protein
MVFIYVLLWSGNANGTENEKGGINPADPCGYEWDEMQPRREYGV